MSICPKCQKEIDMEHYKKRGNCKFCGYKITNVDLSEDIVQKNKLVRTSAAKLKSKNQNRADTSGKDDILSKKNTSGKKDVQDNGVSDTLKRPEVTDEHTEIPSYSDFVEESIQNPNSIKPTDENKNSDSVTRELFDDPIFLNNTGPLDFNDPEKEANDTDQDNLDEQLNISMEKAVDQDSGSSTGKKIEKKESPLFLRLLLYIPNKYHESRSEQLEADMTFHFNDDKYYNDNLPQVLPDTDTVSVNSILKVVLSILGIFLFIMFIIYYA